MGTQFWTIHASRADSRRRRQHHSLSLGLSPAQERRRPPDGKTRGDVLYVRFPNEDQLRIVYGSDVLQISQPRFMWSNYIRVLRDKDIKFSLYGWNSLLSPSA